MPWSVAREGWLDLPYVHEWRQQLRQRYIEGTKHSLLTHRPSLFGVSGRRPSDTTYRRELILWGRAGVPARSPAVATRDAKRLFGLQRRRQSLCAALDKLVTDRPLAVITVDDVLKTATTSRASFYGSYRSGLPGLRCTWVTQELDALTQRTKDRIDSLRKRRGPRFILLDWTERVSAFLLERPFGRLSINSFLTHEIDGIGAAAVARLHQPNISASERARRESAVSEFVQLAADCHRAGARLIHQVQSVFEMRGAAALVDTPLAKRLWGERRHRKSSVTWNLAVSLWQAAFSSVHSLGFLEAEHVADQHRRFMFYTWFKGVAVHQQKQHRRDRRRSARRPRVR